MTLMTGMETIIQLQSELMGAIDARDAGEIETKTRDLARALDQIRNRGAMVVGEKLKTDVSHALKQTEALRTRVNFMALHNREKMERLDQMRGASMPHVYANPRNIGISSQSA